MSANLYLVKGIPSIHVDVVDYVKDWNPAEFDLAYGKVKKLGFGYCSPKENARFGRPYEATFWIKAERLQKNHPEQYSRLAAGLPLDLDFDEVKVASNPEVKVKSEDEMSREELLKRCRELKAVIRMNAAKMRKASK